MGPFRDVRTIVLPIVGKAKRDAADVLGVVFTDASGSRVPAVELFFRNLIANGASTRTPYSYAQDLLRWWRFLHAVGIPWNRASRTEVDDFVLWMRQATPKHGGDWRHRSEEGAPAVGGRFAPRTITHSIAVLAAFYTFHEQHDGPISPVPPVGRNNAHHNPGQPFDHSRRADGRQKIPWTAPKALTDDEADDLTASLRHTRDEAIVEFFLSSGARASELLGMNGEDLDWGRQRIRVRRKGSNAEQWLPASPEAFVLLRKHLGTRPLPWGVPVWSTLRGQSRRLTYHAFRAALRRAQHRAGTNHTMHVFRHTAAYRFANESDMTVPQVKELLGHRFITTTQIYTEARPEEVLEAAAAYLRGERRQPIARGPMLQYSDKARRALFGRPPA
ncbi:tyrosine-type recombinase/integrase [Curtobacterium sp. MCBA15_013]|uniref:tyrosine-type recombinase/integrase n=1 Tax=Curtobacterium sp. MCBA15_013 TaxID=1898739 RepID=UPI0008DDA6BF|nr:site-specific integrase [Curtobacterium sp. MCBA15_013]OII25846.1 hypothetical protein BIV01_10360 [Curtobacterium sp. MCBA15_013]